MIWSLLFLISLQTVEMQIHSPSTGHADFISAVLAGMLSIIPMCAQSAGEWLVTFLKKCRGDNYAQG